MTRRLLTGATMRAGAACTLRPAWLLIEDEAVAAVGEQGQPPPGGQALDLSGHHILPGFADVHLHLSPAAWFHRGGDALGWRDLAGEAVRAQTVTAAASPGAPGSGGLAPGQAAGLVICDGDRFAPGTPVTQAWNQRPGRIAARRARRATPAPSRRYPAVKTYKR
jgi:imidazolonepropionase-like amidohydrolase